ncbi:hypothetical protein [Streptomyces canus]|uniref:Uncharacterized protein n=1 Tax=Streptomyces canus TaxID=58343 RepID=A0AAW8FFM3_9ACTN|nr:hypothetical protein [Streptomyces canus]MDQ0762590.1 hypothetical protein [Streptomyces canus]MDQ0908941.1 hypothetical protein [Streptomyces canus]MDQ1068968.1 hypothetical protein [Streptomyces canus]
MTGTQAETPVEESVPGRTRWGVFIAILAVPTLVVAALIALLVAWLFTDDSVDPGVRKVSCAEALDFGGARLPAGARDPGCHVEAGPEPRFEASFRMRTDEVGAWLAATYPDEPALRTKQCGSRWIDACLNVGPVAGQHAAVQVEVVHDGPHWSDVRFVAFTL